MSKTLKATKLKEYIIEPLKTGYSNKWEGHHATNPCLVRLKNDNRVFLGYRAGGYDDYYWVNGWDVWASHMGLAILDSTNCRVEHRLPLPIMTIVRDVKLPQNAADFKEYCKAHRDDILIMHDFRFFEYQGYLHVIYHESSVLDVWDCVVRMPVKTFLNKIDESLKLMNQPVEKIIKQWHDIWWKEDTWQPCGINGSKHIFGSFVIKGDIVYFEKPDGSLQMCHRPLADAVAVVDVGTKLYADRTADGFTEYGVCETCIRPGYKDNSHLGNNGMPSRAKIGDTEVYIDVTHGCFDKMIADENCNERHILYYPYFRVKDYHTGDVLYYSEEPILDYDEQWKEYTQNGEWVSKNAALDGVMFTGGQIEAVPGKNGIDDTFIAYIGIGDTAIGVAKFTLRQLLPDTVIEDIASRSKKSFINYNGDVVKNTYEIEIPVNGWNWKIENDCRRVRINVVRSLSIDGKIEKSIRPIHTAPGYFDADAIIFDGSSVAFLPDVGWAIAYKGIRWTETKNGDWETQVGFGVLLLHRNNPEKLIYRSTSSICTPVIEKGRTLGQSVNTPAEIAQSPFKYIPANVIKETRRIGVLMDKKLLPLPQMVVWQQQKSQILGRNFRYGLF